MIGKYALTNCLIVYLTISHFLSYALINCADEQAMIQSLNSKMKSTLLQICTIERKKSNRLNVDHDFSHLEHTNSYVEMITHLDKFIDRSILIEKTILGAKNRLVTVPNGSGKTTNLDMIAFFAQMEINDQGKLVHPSETKAYRYFTYGIINLSNGQTKLSKLPLISTKNHIMLRSVANCIVIQLKLDRIVIDDFNSFFYSFKEAIAHTFLQHNYLEKVLDAERLEKFQKIRDCMENDQEIMETSIQLLTEMLKGTYKRKVIITIDDLDNFFVIHEAPHTDLDTKEINKFFKAFLTASLKENFYYWNALMTSITPLAEMILKELNLINFSPHDQTKMKDLYPFFENVESEIGDDRKV